jgi:hypothetical protein
LASGLPRAMSFKHGQKEWSIPCGGGSDGGEKFLDEKNKVASVDFNLFFVSFLNYITEKNRSFAHKKTVR